MLSTCRIRFSQRYIVFVVQSLIFLLCTLSTILQIFGLDLTLIFKHLQDHRQRC